MIKPIEAGVQISMFDKATQPRKRMKGDVTEISIEQAKEFLLPRHYSGRVPTISKAFAIVYKGEIKAVCTFGKPASPFLCSGVCGEKYAQNVYELNRLCREENFNEPLSSFVSACLRRLRIYHWIIVSYSDTAMNHHGYIYQACNFLYTGMTNERTDICSGDGNHARHYSDEDKKSGKRIIRSAKHRYVYFCTYIKEEKKRWMKELKYPILPYPKGDNNEDYELGNYLKPVIIPSNKGDDVN